MGVPRQIQMLLELQRMNTPLLTIQKQQFVPQTPTVIGSPILLSIIIMIIIMILDQQQQLRRVPCLGTPKLELRPQLARQTWILGPLSPRGARDVQGELRRVPLQQTRQPHILEQWIRTRMLQYWNGQRMQQMQTPHLLPVRKLVHGRIRRTCCNCGSSYHYGSSYRIEGNYGSCGHTHCGHQY